MGDGLWRWVSVGFGCEVVGVSGGVWRVARRFWGRARWVREGIGEEFVGERGVECVRGAWQSLRVCLFNV